MKLGYWAFCAAIIFHTPLMAGNEIGCLNSFEGECTDTNYFKELVQSCDSTPGGAAKIAACTAVWQKKNPGLPVPTVVIAPEPSPVKAVEPVPVKAAEPAPVKAAEAEPAKVPEEPTPVAQAAPTEDNKARWEKRMGDREQRRVERKAKEEAEKYENRLEKAEEKIQEDKKLTRKERRELLKKLKEEQEATLKGAPQEGPANAEDVAQ